jgi:flagellar basal body P-ring formation protein FlgA
MTSFRHAAVVALILTGAPAMAQAAWQDMAIVDAAVATRLDAAIGSPGGALRAADRRLRLRVCAAAPLVDAPANGSVMVSCPSAGWRLFVPVDGGGDQREERAAQSAAPAPSARAATAIRRGERVRVSFRGEGFSILVNAQALTASSNGRLRVRTDRGAIWEARVDADGRIFVDALN